MVLGTTLFRMDGNAYYSPPFPRGGGAATFSADVTHISDAPQFDIEVQHKNNDDTSWGTAGNFTGITTVSLNSLRVTSLKEQIRFKYSFTTTDAADAVHFVMLAPVWEVY